jgi:signal transduction histidine kinase
MPETKQHIQAARKVYDTYWASYLKGDVVTFTFSIDETYEMIGTSETEVCHSKEEGIRFFEAQMKEVVGKTEIRNREIVAIPVNNLVLINEHSDIYVLVDSAWIFYSKIRISTLLRETETGWKVMQQHGSLPDMRVQEGETMAIEKINRENIELRDAIKRRTAELERKNHELEIEAALERVRTIAMGMKKPGDLLDVCRTISEQLELLHIGNIRNVQVAIVDEPKRIYANYQYFTAYTKGIFEETEYEENFASLAMVTEMQKSANAFFIGSIKGDELIKFREWRNEYKQFPDPILDQSTELFYYFYSIGQGGLGLTTYQTINENELEIFKRFHLVFKLAYSRFMDIQKAEAQAREAEIELALERIRASTMAMHSSDDLSRVAFVLFDQMKMLGGDLFAFGIVLCDKHKNTVEQWHSLKDGGMTPPFQVPVDLDYIHQYRFEQWKAGEKLFSIEIPEDYIARHFELMFEVPSVKEAIEEVEAKGVEVEIPTWEIDYGASFNHGYLLISSLKPFQEDHIFSRFAKVFEQAYTRFLDLQKAEAQARESRLELSLERIRAQVTAMQESAELLDIVVMMRTEFVNLGHEAHYFWYMRWLPEKYEKAMTSGDGTRIGMVMTLPRYIHGDVQLVADWEKSDEPTVVFAMDEETAVDYVHKMITLGDFKQVDPQAPTLDDIRDLGGLTFIMARTQHGEIGFSLPGTVPDPPKDALETLRRFAGVFDLAYKRFEDLKNAEKDLIEIKAARQKAEETLAELKATQVQLIQQEKLASLGQLTAGIAHEIKNPLNFVKNFSEVSIEMIDEVLEEIASVEEIHEFPLQGISELLDDIKTNLHKIHEHGTRADGIVKSMLQHSRGGSGKMEPTDLNALIKKYTNLAFHGMRAGKNPINVVMDLQLDEQIKTVPLVEEDFSRVLLNLCNNAFDALRETADKRQPKLTIRTKLELKYLLIEVEDNGSGIPDEIKDKILQPFFTTKKGTQGTGLGLSITNDIIKAHGGKLEIESGAEGSKFKIHLAL